MKGEYITTKEDFRDKYIKIPNNLSKKKWDKIKLKLERMGFENFGYFNYCLTMSYDNKCLFIWKDGDIGICYEYLALEQITNPKVISIKDFLAEPKKEETYSIFANDIEYKIPKEYQFARGLIFSNNESYICEYCGKGIYLEIAKAKGIEPGEFVCPHCLNKKEFKTFNSPEEALKWLCENPMKEIEYQMDYHKNLNDSIYIERYNPNLGPLGLEKCFQFRWKDGSLPFERSYFPGNFSSVKWKNIREYREDKYECENAMEINGTLKINGKIILNGETIE